MCGHHPAGACQAHGQHGLSLATAEPTCGRRNAHGSKEPAPMCGPGSQQPSLSLPAKNICWPEQPMPPLCCLEMFPDQKDWRNRSRNPTALERVPERQTERGGNSAADGDAEHRRTLEISSPIPLAQGDEDTATLMSGRHCSMYPMQKRLLAPQEPNKLYLHYFQGQACT